METLIVYVFLSSYQGAVNPLTSRKPHLSAESFLVSNAGQWPPLLADYPFISWFFTVLTPLKSPTPLGWYWKSMHCWKGYWHLEYALAL